MPDGILTPCNVACGSGMVTVNSPSGSTLQCYRWLWDDMPLNSPKRLTYWNSTSGNFLVSISTHHRSRHVILYQSEKFCSNRTVGRKKYVMSIFKMADLSHLGCRDPIMNSLKSLVKLTSYRSSIDTIALNCLVFD